MKTDVHKKPAEHFTFEKAPPFTYLMVALTQGLASKLTPDISSTFLSLCLCLLLDRKCTLHGSLDITTGKSKAESGTGLSHKVKSHLGKALGLKVRNDRATTQTAVAHHMHDLTILRNERTSNM
jgi:hypothetical protein